MTNLLRQPGRPPEAHKPFLGLRLDPRDGVKASLIAAAQITGLDYRAIAVAVLRKHRNDFIAIAEEECARLLSEDDSIATAR